jgi:ABC-type nitrate/sulfonate/bicarbonate transport system substrate-binding protein
MAGAIDVVLTADQPAITLFSKDKGWKAIGRLMYNRTATYVPVKSDIQNISQLKGKTIAVPMGAAAERVLKEALTENKMDTKDVKLVNLGIMEHGPVIQKNKNAKKWGDFDAMAGFDPTPAILEANGLVRVIHTGKVTSMVLMNESMTKSNPQIAQKVMQSIFDAYDYYRKNQKQANAWFLEESRLKGGDQKACELAAQLEPNLKATDRSAMSLTLSPEDLTRLKTVSSFLEPQIKKSVDVSKYIDDSAAKNLK